MKHYETNSDLGVYVLSSGHLLIMATSHDHEKYSRKTVHEIDLFLSK